MYIIITDYFSTSYIPLLLVMNELVQDDTAAPYSHEIESFQTVMEPVEGSVS